MATKREVFEDLADRLKAVIRHSLMSQRDKDFREAEEAGETQRLDWIRKYDQAEPDQEKPE